ncbi:MAG: hypothetical protein A2Y38_16250 [Spirochaetes bacterium GWB1_59_5]|nr:MAG: hypothetical protein A2Y38_16250 [Spirochaetes bacterium GWB1_59_5]
MYKFLASRIKTLRVNLGLTQEQMADMLGKRVQQISIWEAGVNCPSMENFLQICNTFDTSPAFFLVDDSTLVEESSNESEIV